MIRRSFLATLGTALAGLIVAPFKVFGATIPTPSSELPCLGKSWKITLPSGGILPSVDVCRFFDPRLGLPWLVKGGLARHVYLYFDPHSYDPVTHAQDQWLCIDRGLQARERYWVVPGSKLTDQQRLQGTSAPEWVGLCHWALEQYRQQLVRELLDPHLGWTVHHGFRLERHGLGLGVFRGTHKLTDKRDSFHFPGGALYENPWAAVNALLEAADCHYAA